MSLPHALLTSLLEKASSGYELARRFDRSIAYFWHASHQQIYRELARMERAGWIASAAAPDGGRTRKRNYHVLEAGRQELIGWVTAPAPLAHIQDELMVRLRADAVIGPLGLDEEINRRMTLHSAKLQGYLIIEAHNFSPGNVPSREARVQHLILKTGIMYEKSWLGWCEEALQVLRETADQVASKKPEKVRRASNPRT